MPHIARCLTTASKHLKTLDELLVCPTASADTLLAQRRTLLAAIIELHAADNYIAEQLDEKLRGMMQ